MCILLPAVRFPIQIFDRKIEKEVRFEAKALVNVIEVMNLRTCHRDQTKQDRTWVLRAEPLEIYQDHERGRVCQ